MVHFWIWIYFTAWTKQGVLLCFGLRWLPEFLTFCLKIKIWWFPLKKTIDFLCDDFCHNSLSFNPVVTPLLLLGPAPPPCSSAQGYENAETSGHKTASEPTGIQIRDIWIMRQPGLPLAPLVTLMLIPCFTVSLISASKCHHLLSSPLFMGVVG